MKFFTLSLFLSSWTWNFGDTGIPDTGRNVTHTYARPGTFDAVLPVANTAGRENRTVTDRIMRKVLHFNLSRMNG